ncbi:unnamed protein product [Penicillium salamii]|uniref:XRCC4 coiled-coil domain-containing protein n=1 Tax=Penicillium salamii TaxID=1612424 RepID=A0A9W4JT91_9EURO|nr:unnamed protein product [Penicillium salamii]CAG8294626.1 unnamed protein product [Penicillium salamii]CAG8368789.1 unnamed protein product [Penicillium salamii]CAG8377595.1 unnamed protein product [Penicillium salamii]CAG8378538.1 unnamed protein product [Penicillium salamii]
MSRVLRFERSDEPGFVLVQVSRNGPAPLDLTLTATEGEAPYVSLVKQARLKDLRAKSYQGSEDEWRQILTFFLGQSAQSETPECVTGLEASATISNSDQDKTLNITIRKRVQTITQRIGTLKLQQNDEQSIELLDWAGVSTARADELQLQVSSLASRYSRAEDTIRDLSQQLEELMQAKAQHETQLVANFVQILNEKKLKVRNQQRLLAAATVNPSRMSEIQAHIPAEPPATTGRSYQAKRSAGSLSDTDASDDFERMDIDRSKSDRGPASGQGSIGAGHSTPQSPEEQVTSSTDDDSSQDQPTQQPPRVVPGDDTAPPQRVLPFTKRTSGVTRSTVAAAAQDDSGATGGETDDDEL